jgi:hypothetical protein
LFDTGYVLPAMKRDEWLRIAETLCRVATVVAPEDTDRASVLREWVREYISENVAASGDEWVLALPESAPFIRDDMLHINTGGLRRFLMNYAMERIERVDLLDMLRAAGFARRQVSGWVDNRTLTRNYWRIDSGRIERASAPEEEDHGPV